MQKRKCSIWILACLKQSGSQGSQRAEMWPVLAKLLTIVPLSINFTIVILMCQHGSFTQICYIFNGIKNDPERISSPLLSAAQVLNFLPSSRETKRCNK